MRAGLQPRRCARRRDPPHACPPWRRPWLLRPLHVRPRSAWRRGYLPPLHRAGAHADLSPAAATATACPAQARAARGRTFSAPRSAGQTARLLTPSELRHPASLVPRAPHPGVDDLPARQQICHFQLHRVRVAGRAVGAPGGPHRRPDPPPCGLNGACHDSRDRIPGDTGRRFAPSRRSGLGDLAAAPRRDHGPADRVRRRRHSAHRHRHSDAPRLREIPSAPLPDRPASAVPPGAARTRWARTPGPCPGSRASRSCRS